jgi:phage host-nuclease inhibitor protein Gam
MAKTIAKKAVTKDQYRETLEAFKSAEVAARDMAVKKDKALSKIETQYNPYFEEYVEQQKERAAIIEEYCVANRTDIFGDKQSATENGITMAFRKGAISVQVLEGNTEDSALVALKANLPDYVAVKESIDKKKLISDRANIEESDLEDCGLYFAQGEETFSVKAAETKVK